VITPTPVQTTPAPVVTPTPVQTTPAPVVTPPPAAGGFPSATTTGPRVSTVALTAKSGAGWSVSGSTLTISGANVTLRGYNIPYEIDVKGPGAVIEDNTISNSGSGWAIGLYKGNLNTVIGHNLIQGPDNSPNHDGGYQQPLSNGLEYGIFDATGNYGGVATTEYNEFRFINHPMNVTSGIVRENYMHTFSNPGGTQHTDAIFSGGGDTKKLLIQHNTLLNDRKDASAAVILLSNAFGKQTNVVIDSNLLAGGGFTIYGGGGGGQWPVGTNITITNNKISTQIFPKGGYYGPLNVMPQNGVNGNVVSGNLWHDGPNAGRAVS
jgi:hypothetical protein